MPTHPHTAQGSTPEEEETGRLVRQEDLRQGRNPSEPQFPPLSNGDNKTCPDYAQSDETIDTSSG